MFLYIYYFLMVCKNVEFTESQQIFACDTCPNIFSTSLNVSFILYCDIMVWLWNSFPLHAFCIHSYQIFAYCPNPILWNKNVVVYDHLYDIIFIEKHLIIYLPQSYKRFVQFKLFRPTGLVIQNVSSIDFYASLYNRIYYIFFIILVGSWETLQIKKASEYH